MKLRLPLFLMLLLSVPSYAVVYHVGPNQAYTNIGDVPWESLAAGDQVFIHWRNTPYHEKWVINGAGTATQPIEIIGVSGPGGEKPIIDGNGATTRTALDFWNEDRGVVKIGGSSTPSNAIPSYITVENLEIRSGRPAFGYTSDNSNAGTYSSNCAAVFIEIGQHITIRDCEIHDCGNGIFVAANGGSTQDITIAHNYIYDNGIAGSFYEHNTYTEAIGITYEYNHFGPLRTGCDGNNLKDRSAGLVVRYNWIEGGNRQLDLVEASTAQVSSDPSYQETHAYGNILIEPDGAGNRQILHYGGDNGTTSNYRKGDLYFYNNTVVSTRVGRTTLARLSTNDETMHAFNNIIYVTDAGNELSMVDASGVLNLENNWMPTGWVNCHGTLTGTVNDLGMNINATDPLFTNENAQDYTLQNASACVDAGRPIPSAILPSHDLLNEYFKHVTDTVRNAIGAIDMGAFEYNAPVSVEERQHDIVQVYPNPANERFHVLLPTGGTYEIRLRDVRGNLIRSQKHTSPSPVRMERGDLSSGIYLLELIDQQGARTVERVVLEH